MRRYSNSTPPLSAAPSLRIKKPCSQSCLNLVLALAIEIFALLCSANSAALALGRLSAYASASRFPGLGSPPTILDRKSVVEGTSVSVRVEFGGCRHIKKKTIKHANQ